MRNKGFTVLEAMIAILVFIIGIGTVSIMYINLVRQHLISQQLQASIGNVKLALEKIWREMKYGINFATTTYGIKFQRAVDCKNLEIYYDPNLKTLIYKLDNNTSTLIDTNYAEINTFEVYATGSLSTSGDYNKTSYKLITLSLNGIAKTKSINVPINFQISVAPINSVFTTTSCGF